MTCSFLSLTFFYVKNAKRVKFHFKELCKSLFPLDSFPLNISIILKVDFEMYKKVRGVITQGDAANRQWVKSYLVMTSMDGKDFDYVRDKNGYVMVRSNDQCI